MTGNQHTWPRSKPDRFLAGLATKAIRNANDHPDDQDAQRVALAAADAVAEARAAAKPSDR